MYFVRINNQITGKYATLKESKDIIIKHWHQSLRFNRLEDLEYANPHEIILHNNVYTIITPENVMMTFDINNFLKNNNIKISTLHPNVSGLYNVFISI
jgi:hypothetical protein